MKLHQEFTIAHPLAEVWHFFHDVPKVAACLPGAEYLGTREDGRHQGRVSAKVGPFQASFEGEAAVQYDDTKNLVELEGKGVDRKGASRGKMSMNCVLQPSGDATNVIVDSDIQLSGTIAQFGRTGLISEVANVLVADFVQNAEAAMDSARPYAQGTGSEAGTYERDIRPSVARPISGFALLMSAVRGLINSWFGRSR